MASILRSSKFVRYIAGFARNIVVNTPREFDGSFINSSSQCFCGAAGNSFATQAQHESLETYIKRMDDGVRRIGRISRKDIEEVLEEIRASRAPTSSQSLLVIRCCGNLVPEELPDVRTKLVQEIWNTLNKLNVPMDISHYNALLRVYLENEHKFSPTEFLKELEKQGMEPNRVTYQRLIAQYCQYGDIDGATKILEFMREKQLPVNEQVFNALINGHSKNGDMESARGILSVMSQAGLDPSTDTYTTLLCGYARKGDIMTINELIIEIEAKELFLTDRDYLELAYCFAVSDHSEHIAEILSKIRRSYGYNQDAINIILRLINMEKDDAAFEILKSMTRNTDADGNRMSTGGFFLRQMIKVERPFETVLGICKRLEAENMFNNAVNYVTECCLQLGKDALSYDFMREMKSAGLPVRQHFFWPLILSKAKDASGKGIIGVLNEMLKYNITPSSETIREYVIPNLKGTSSEIISKLREANISIGSAACSLVYCLLQDYEIKEAAVLVQSIPAYYHPDQLKKPLTAAYYRTHDVESYVTILRQVYENLDKKYEVEADAQSLDKSEMVGRYVLDLAHTGRHFNDHAVAILSALIDQGLSISTVTAERLQEKLAEKMTPEISSLLSRLSSGDLTPIPIERKVPAYTPSSQMNIPQLERLVQNLETRKQETKGLKRQLLTLYYRNKELQKMEDLIKNLEGDPEFKYTAGVYVQLLDTAAYHENYDKTVAYLEKVKEFDPNFALDESKVMRVATVMVKSGHLQEALEFLSKPRTGDQQDRNFNYNALCWRLLTYLADAGSTDDLQTLFDTMVRNNYLEINNVNLGPLVKVHLVNKDLDAALAKFEWCCNQFKVTPWKNELACQLIQAEDAEKLQKLTDLSTSVHGEINSLYDLVFAFVECGRIRQARKILETPGLQSRPQRINVACQRYQQEGKVIPLEGLRDATRDLNHIDRSDIYYQLLLSYIKQNDVDKATSLWTQMQEEDLPANDGFLLKLGTFLKQNNVEVPFAMPHTQQEPNSADEVVAAQVPPKKDITQFRHAVKIGELDRALQIKQSAKEPFTFTDLSLLIEKLVQADRQTEASKLTLEMLEKGASPLTRVFRFLLNKLANAGDVDTLEQIGAKLDSETKKTVSFDNRICHANLTAGRASEYLRKLEAEIDNVEDSELASIAEKFPRGGAVGILERYPELVEQYENLAIKYAKKNIVAPVNVLWSHYFIRNNEEKANSVWTLYLQGAPRIMFQRVVQHIREVGDEVLAEKLIAHLKLSQVTEGALGNAYSCLLDVLVAKHKTDEAVAAFETAIKTVPIDQINRTAVLRVKEVYDSLQKPFDHKIPPKNKNQAQTSSSSSSDEEHREKRK